MTSTLEASEPELATSTYDDQVPYFETIIEARSKWRLIDWKELYNYRDLLRFLVWREIKVRYAQSAIGIGWAIIQPVFSMIVFTVVFGNLAALRSDGLPYALFSLCALVPWTYFSNALVDGTNSLVNEANMLKKVYFPRILMPLSAVFAKLVDFSIAICLVFLMMGYFQVLPTWGVMVIPLLMLLMMSSAFGLACWFTAFAIQYRDVKHAMSFFVQSLIYTAPVIYSVDEIPERFQLLYALNPMVGVIEGFRSALLGSRPMPWSFIAIGILTSSCITLTGILYFNRKERIFADVA